MKPFQVGVCSVVKFNPLSKWSLRFAAFVALLAFSYSSPALADPCEGDGKLSDVICNVMDDMQDAPGFITALAYMVGLLFGVWGLFKLKDHVINPNQTPLSDSIKRFVAGGALFTLPLITQAAQDLINDGTVDPLELSEYAGDSGGTMGLDGLMLALMQDLFTPLISITYVACYVIGLILVFVGVTRMIKTAQDGPRGPASFGTIMTFIIAGALFSLASLLGAFSVTLFGDSTVATYAVLQTEIDGGVIDDHVLAVISTILAFMTIVGLFSFIRGFFILREVAEGHSQASIMAAITHIIGGVIAVNLGPFLNAVQSTFGLDTLGVLFEI